MMMITSYGNSLLDLKLGLDELFKKSLRMLGQRYNRKCMYLENESSVKWNQNKPKLNPSWSKNDEI